MKVIGFNFNKITAERLSNQVENLKINSNIDVSDIKEAKSNFFKIKEELISVDFSYTLNYDPSLAKIEFKGSIVFSLEPKKAKEILRQWKDKKIAIDFREALFNVILRKTALKALQLEGEINVPSHIQLSPNLKFEDKKE